MPIDLVDAAGGGSPRFAVVADHDDLVLDVYIREASVKFVNSGGVAPQFSAQYESDVIVRYTKSGSVFWTQNLGLLAAESTFVTGQVALADDGDVIIPDTLGARIFRLNGTTGSSKWIATLSPNANVGVVIPRRGKGDFLVLGPPSGTVLLSNDGLSVNVLANGAADGGLSLANGTVWLWGKQSGALRLDPFSTMTWNVSATNTPAFLVGDTGSGSAIGPWFSEGQIGPLWSAADDGSGSLLLAATAFSLTRINGQDLAAASGQVLAKLSPTSGTLLWRTTTSASTSTAAVSLAPTRDAMVIDTGAVSFFDGASGAPLSSFSIPGTAAGMIGATGTATAYFMGHLSAPADFDPGPGVDMQGSDAPGIFISQYSF